MMKKIDVKQLPKCDFCHNSASYDIPTIYGPWANCCKACALEKGANMEIGTEYNLVAPPKSPKVGQIVIGIERTDDEYFKLLISDEIVRTVKCPECGTENHIDLDAVGTYTCFCGCLVSFKEMV